MVKEQINKSDQILDSIVSTPYKYGFTTDVETEEFEKGLNEKIVQKISRKKEEPEFLLAFREKAYRVWKKMNNPAWAALSIPEIDYSAKC